MSVWQVGGRIHEEEDSKGSPKSVSQTRVCLP
jgi:hypothetical protein